MFEQLFKHMQPVSFTEVELQQIISFDIQGKQVTLGDLIAQITPAEALGRLGLPQKAPRQIKPVDHLNAEEEEQIVAAHLATVPADEAFAVVGHGSYTVKELRAEVHKRTPIGRRYIEIVKQYNRFLEEAARRGTIQHTAHGDDDVQLPPFDF